MERYPKEDYSFPHVRFTEEVVSPPSIQRSYRDTIGIVGEFSKGPLLARVTNRQQFRALFGEDAFAGSVAVQQAMLQGATNFIISRATPTSKPGNALIQLSPSSDQDQFDSEIGNNSDPSILERTIGLELKHSLISKPYVRQSKSLGAIFQTPTSSSAPFYDSANDEYILTGKFTVDISVVEYIMYGRYKDGAGDPVYEGSALPIDPANTNLNGEAMVADQMYLLELNDYKSLDSDLVKLFQKTAKPGLKLSTAGVGTEEFTIESYVWTENDKLSLFVTATTAFTFSDPLNLYVDTPSSNGGHYVLGFSHNSIFGDAAPETIFTKDIKQGHAFATLQRTNNSYQNISYYSMTSPTQYEKFDTGISFQVGDALSSDSPNVDGNYKNLQPNFFLNEGVTVSIDVLNSQVVIGAQADEEEENAFEEGKTGISLLQELADQISLADGLSNIVTQPDIQDFTLPYSLTMTTSFSGREGNRLQYKLSRFVSDSTAEADIDDINYTSDGSSIMGTWVNYQGGRDASLPAKRTFYDRSGNPILEVETKTRSIEGNNVSVSVFPIGAGEFRLEIYERNEDTPIEVFSLNNRDIDINTGLYSQILDSNIVNARFLPAVDNVELSQSIINALPERLEPPNRFVTDSNDLRNPSAINYNQLLGVSLVGGSDELTENSVGITEYQEAIYRLDREDISILALTGYHAGQSIGRSLINSALSQANESSPFNGIRTVVAAVPPNITKSVANSIGSFYDSDRLTLVAGWTSFTSNRALGFNNTSPVGIYAGKIADINPSISPNAQTTVSGVLSSDLNARPDVLDAVTRAGIEALYFDTSTNRFKFLNGRTTAKSSSRKWITLRRVTDHIITNLKINLAWARALPNTPDLRSKVASSVNAYLETLVQEGMILSFIPALVDNSNNSPSDVVSGRLNVRITYTPLLPADIISVGVVRSLTDSIDI